MGAGFGFDLMTPPTKPVRSARREGQYDPGVTGFTCWFRALGRSCCRLSNTTSSTPRTAEPVTRAQAVQRPPQGGHRHALRLESHAIV